MPGCPTGETPVLRRLHVGQNINVDQGVADCVVFAADDRSGISWWALDDDGRLIIVRRGEAAGLNFGLLTILPVIVRGEQRAIPIVHLEDWIGQNVGHTKLAQGRSKSAHDYLYYSIAADKTGDHDVLISIDKTADADVGKSNRHRVIQVVSFHQAYPGGVIFAAHDGGVITRRKVIAENGGFLVIGRSLSCRTNRGLLRIFPIIVRLKETAVSSV